MIEPSSDLTNIDSDFLKNKYAVRLFGEFDQSFIDKFIEKFIDVKNLDVGSQYGVSNSFVYSLPNLEGLVMPLYKDHDFVLDCSKLPESLYSLNINIYSKNKITQIETLNETSLEHLTISGFTEKDLTKISSLKNLKSLDLQTSRIKSLKGIESLINVKVLSFGGVRSLIDISGIEALQKLKFLEFDNCWKLEDLSTIKELKELEVLKIVDCKNLASIQFVKELPQLRQLYTLGTTVINDFDTTPAKDIPIYFGSRSNSKYNANYPEKEIKEDQKTAGSFLKD